MAKVICNERWRCSEAESGMCGGAVLHEYGYECDHCVGNTDARCITPITRELFDRWMEGYNTLPLSEKGTPQQLGKLFMEDFYPDTPDVAVRNIASTVSAINLIERKYIIQVWEVQITTNKQVWERNITDNGKRTKA